MCVCVCLWLDRGGLQGAKLAPFCFEDTFAPRACLSSAGPKEAVGARADHGCNCSCASAIYGMLTTLVCACVPHVHVSKMMRIP
jgi:hypothetical protein